MEHRSESHQAPPDDECPPSTHTGKSLVFFFYNDKAQVRDNAPNAPNWAFSLLGLDPHTLDTVDGTKITPIVQRLTLSAPSGRPDSADDDGEVVEVWAYDGWRTHHFPPMMIRHAWGSGVQST